MDEMERRELGECDHCGTKIWSDHPYSWCSECGNSLPAAIKEQFAESHPAQAQASPSEQGTTLVVEGKTIPCPICGHGRFWTRKTLMDTRGSALFGFDWANASAVNYICNRCGHVLWFLGR